ncbi:hypothetical protein JW948_00680 [bacterium]|nr:hypothetical protein [bacterium]
MVTLNRRLFSVPITAGFVLASLYFIPVSCMGQVSDKRVQEAYELRMKGQADSARDLLEKILVQDSTNAAAWYELARTTQHIGLGNPRTMFTALDEAEKAIEDAVENDPDNIIYLFYKGNIDFTKVYVSMMRQQPGIQDQVKKAVSTYESVLSLKPDYHEAKLFLVELLKMVPPDMGGDSAKAEKYTRELEKADIVSGAKARELMMPEGTDVIAFWEKIKKDRPDNADVNEALGKAYLYHDNIGAATRCFEEAMQMDSGKHILYVDLGRYYMMQAMQNPAKLDSLAPMMIKNLEMYLKTQPEPVNPLKAYVIASLAKINFHMGNQEDGSRLNNEAMALDPNYSRAFGIPGRILFDLPDEISHFHAWFSRPF